MKVKITEIKDEKIRFSKRALNKDPLDWFNDKKINQIITVKIISSDNKGLTVRPEGCEIDFSIKKNQIALCQYFLIPFYNTLKKIVVLPR